MIFSKLDLGKLKVYVFDTDTLNIEALAEYGINMPHGWGETYWIKNFRIEHFLDRYNEADAPAIIAYAHELISKS